MRVGITLPVLGEQGIPDVPAMARHVEQLGLDAVRVPDLILGDGSPALESTVVAAAAAAVTERVGIAFGVRVLPLQPVAWLAAQIAALQHVSRHRVELGVGPGGFPRSPFWRAVGVPAADRGRRTDAALELLPSLIAGDEVTVDGTPLRLAPGAPVPPILVGGNSDVAIRRAVARGDGWLPSNLTPDALAPRARALRDLAAGRPMRVVVAGGAAPGDDAAARSAYEGFLGQLVRGYGIPAEQAAGIPVTGSPARIAERLAAYAEAGADAVGLSVLAADWPRAVELIAEAKTRLS